MSYLPPGYYGQPQEAYNPPVGPPPATREEIEDYDRMKRRSNILILVVVGMVVMLIALLIAVFVVAIGNKSDDDGDERDDDISCTIYYIAPSSSNKPVPSAMKIEMIARSSAVTYTSVYANPSNSDYQSLAIDTCKQLETAIRNKGYVIGGCTISSMRTAATSGIEMLTSITVLNDGTKTDSELLLGVGSTLTSGIQAPLEIITNTIKRDGSSGSCNRGLRLSVPVPVSPLPRHTTRGINGRFNITRDTTRGEGYEPVINGRLETNIKELDGPHYGRAAGRRTYTYQT
ncbi:hypothetical protein LSH36_1291g00069 [Paralvinella palmiformis]|uniref:SEA domain-containing protein n=1 Tax=Paralvinella palmiformis TaxID=53620 RepID=A0AAD9ITC9_9ANNE|nr:hypothetical protein LSH36_1291g00069 [Paralvinella palmiformis]